MRKRLVGEKMRESIVVVVCSKGGREGKRSEEGGKEERGKERE